MRLSSLGTILGEIQLIPLDREISPLRISRRKPSKLFSDHQPHLNFAGKSSKGAFYYQLELYMSSV